MLATFVAYAPAMRNSFVWDDTALVLRDPLIRSWRLAPDAFREFLFLDATASNFYRPLQRLTYIADYAAWGVARPAEAPTAKKTGAPDTGDEADMAAVQRAAQPGWHFTSVLLHALAAMALCWLLTVWMGNGGGWWALGGSLVWAVHPLFTSAVTYVSGRADSLAALFVFSALALVAKAHAQGGLTPGDRPGARRIIGAALCALAALLSKESGAAALALWLVWICTRATRDARSWIAWLMAVAIAVGAYAALRTTAARTPPPVPQEVTPWKVRPILMARTIAEYSALLIAPHSLHMERDIFTKPAGDPATNLEWSRKRELQTLAGCVVIAGLLFWWRWSRKRTPDAALALVCAGATWLPISNVVSLNATVAEHWLYVPAAFLIAAGLFTARAIVTQAFQPVSPQPTGWKACATLLATWLGFLFVQTWRQQSYWHDQRHFITETATRAGRGARMLVNLSQLSAQDGRPADALRLCKEALALEPKLALAKFNIAALAFRQKDYDGALAAMTGLESSPMFEADVLVLRAAIEKARTGQTRFDLLAAACSASGRNWRIARQYPLAFAAAGKPQKAYEDILAQLTARPFRNEAWRLLGQLAEEMGQLREAARAYGEAANRDVRDDVSRECISALRTRL